MTDQTQLGFLKRRGTDDALGRLRLKDTEACHVHVWCVCGCVETMCSECGVCCERVVCNRRVSLVYVCGGGVEVWVPVDVLEIQQGVIWAGGVGNRGVLGCQTTACQLGK